MELRLRATPQSRAPARVDVTATINHSTLSGNTASARAAGASSRPPLRSRTTLAVNSANGGGGVPSAPTGARRARSRHTSNNSRRRPFTRVRCASQHLRARSSPRTTSVRRDMLAAAPGFTCSGTSCQFTSRLQPVGRHYSSSRPGIAPLRTTTGGGPTQTRRPCARWDRDRPYNAAVAPRVSPRTTPRHRPAASATRSSRSRRLDSTCR